MKKKSVYKLLMLGLVVYSCALYSLTDECASYRLKVVTNYIVYDEDELPNSESLMGELNVLLKTDTSIQWRIPNSKDLDLMKKCHRLRNQLDDSIYYWTHIKVGVFIKCFKIDKETGEMYFEKRVSSDGAYGIFISNSKKSDESVEGQNKEWFKYRVVHGNNLWGIIKSFNINTSPDNLKKIGKFNNNYQNGKFLKLKTGDILKFPVPEDCQNGIEEISYLIKKGDRLEYIASKFLQKSIFKNKKEFIDAICTWNGIKNVNNINTPKMLVLYLRK